jgi:tRNA nucleotidyltransferase (CCA-adding enzyme)
LWCVTTPDPSEPDREPRLLDLAKRVATAVRRAGGRAYLVGGTVRDRRLGIPIVDVDLEVFGLDAERVRELLASLGRVDAVGRQFGVFKLTTEGSTIDVGLPRRERTTGDGHRAFDVVPDPHLDVAAAAARRDLTINALLEDPLDGTLVDPWHGLADLERGILRHVSSAFVEDPLRVLRVVQFAARFGFAIADETAALCRAIDLASLPAERIAVEVSKWLLAPRPALGLAALVATGAAKLFPPLGLAGIAPSAGSELVTSHRGIRLDAAAARCAGLDDPLAMMLAALLAPLPGVAFERDATRDLLATIASGARRQELASALCEALESAMAQALEPPFVRRLALRAPLAALASLAAAEGVARSRSPARGEELAAVAASLGVLTAPPRPLLQGRDLLALGLPAGPAVGRLLAAAFEAQLDGAFGDREGALRWLATARPPPAP